MAATDARFFGDKFLAMECTLEVETSVSNLTQHKLFIGDDKKIRFFGVTFSFNPGWALTGFQNNPALFSTINQTWARDPIEKPAPGQRSTSNKH